MHSVIGQLLAEEKLVPQSKDDVEEALWVEERGSVR